MKSFNKLLVFLLLIPVAFFMNLHAQDTKMAVNEANWLDYGESFKIQDVKSGQEALAVFGDLEKSQSSEVQIKGEVSAVCQVKGCWMIVNLSEGQQTRVSFKDYGFFVPKDIVGKEVVVKGSASVAEISEADRKHYAEDAGLSKAEIDKITGVERSYSMIADGVLIRE